MASTTRCSRRPRSQSASSPIRALVSTDDPKWRRSFKRTRPSNPCSPTYKDLMASGEPPEKWDVDQWRRGKRARMQRDTLSGDGARDTHVYSLAPAFAERHTARPASFIGLPCTSAAFDLFPERRRRRARHASPPSPLHDAGMSAPNTNLAPSDELDHLRSYAFWELQRSVAESSEGFVQRLRDWEDARSRPSPSPPLSPRHSREESSSRPRRMGIASPFLRETQPELGTVCADEEDDIEIVSGEPASGSAHSHNRSPSHKKRALSLSVMDIDTPGIEVHSSTLTSAEPSERCSSPVSAFTGPSACSSDDDMSAVESECEVRPYATPALTHTYTISSNPSAISLSPDRFSPLALPNPCAVNVPTSASRSEKALAALTLAMANGACGLNDYSALHDAEALAMLDSHIDDCQAGELWH